MYQSLVLLVLVPLGTSSTRNTSATGTASTTFVLLALGGPLGAAPPVGSRNVDKCSTIENSLRGTKRYPKGRGKNPKALTTSKMHSATLSNSKKHKETTQINNTHKKHSKRQSALKCDKHW